jgi:hypothetical protein
LNGPNLPKSFLTQYQTEKKKKKVPFIFFPKTIQDIPSFFFSPFFNSPSFSSLAVRSMPFGFEFKKNNNNKNKKINKNSLIH